MGSTTFIPDHVRTMAQPSKELTQCKSIIDTTRSSITKATHPIYKELLQPGVLLKPWTLEELEVDVTSPCNARWVAVLMRLRAGFVLGAGKFTWVLSTWHFVDFWIMNKLSSSILLYPLDIQLFCFSSSYSNGTNDWFSAHMLKFSNAHFMIKFSQTELLVKISHNSIFWTRKQ